MTPRIKLVTIPGMQKFSSHARREFPRVLVFARPSACMRCEDGHGSKQRRDWHNSLWHSLQISLTVV